MFPLIYNIYSAKVALLRWTGLLKTIFQTHDAWPARALWSQGSICAAKGYSVHAIISPKSLPVLQKVSKYAVVNLIFKWLQRI